jgi:hypothetical protein
MGVGRPCYLFPRAFASQSLVSELGRVSPFSYKGVGTPSPRGSAAGFSLDGAARPRAHCTDGSPHHGLGEYGERAEQPKQREKPQKPLRSDEAQPWVHGQSLLSVISKPDLLVEPNHHERKSNQKEEAWGCTVVFPVSHSAIRVSCGGGGSVPAVHRPRGTSLPETKPGMIMPLCERFARVVPLRAVNERLKAPHGWHRGSVGYQQHHRHKTDRNKIDRAHGSFSFVSFGRR